MEKLRHEYTNVIHQINDGKEFEIILNNLENLHEKITDSTTDKLETIIEKVIKCLDGAMQLCENEIVKVCERRLRKQADLGKLT